MITIEEIIQKEKAISLVGLGYVGLPIAVAFAEKVEVIGFDVNKEKINTYKKGIDPTKEVGDEVLKTTTVQFTHDPADLKKAHFHIVAVPTPIHTDKNPDLTVLEKATQLVGENLINGAVVVFESTVYPGVTEDICVPILEKASGMVCGQDFFVGYSPERINPGDKVHTLANIVKVVAGMDEATLDVIAKVYELVIDAGVYRASGIKVAEAAKVIENSQRDLNIAFMNELAVIFNQMGIDTLEVLEAAGTKWNFLKFVPGLVGGHCIGVDPYYLTYAAQKLGYQPEVILAGRRINDNMGRFVGNQTVKQLAKEGKDISQAKVALLGFTFKEDCPDIRNTRVIDIVEELGEYGIKPMVCDPHADAEETLDYYGLKLTDIQDVSKADCVIVAVGHQMFKTLDVTTLLAEKGLVVDVKGVFSGQTIEAKGHDYWRL